MQFRKARPDERTAVAALYRSVIGQPGSTWDEHYPGEIHLQQDFSGGNAYVLLHDGVIIGAVSVIVPREYDELGFWQVCDGGQCEIGRVVIDRAAQGHGYAREMLSRLMTQLADEGFRAVHVLAAEGNPPARRTYEKLGFLPRGTYAMYGNNYVAYEKLLPADA